jgi:hypothetical protein
MDEKAVPTQINQRDIYPGSALRLSPIPMLGPGNCFLLDLCRPLTILTSLPWFRVTIWLGRLRYLINLYRSPPLVPILDWRHPEPSAPRLQCPLFFLPSQFGAPTKPREVDRERIRTRGFSLCSTRRIHAHFGECASLVATQCS